MLVYLANRTMLRNYIKEKSRSAYQKSDLEAAVNIYRSNGEIAISSLAKETGITYSILFDWISIKWLGLEKRPTKRGKDNHFRAGRLFELTSLS